MSVESFCDGSGTTTLFKFIFWCIYSNASQNIYIKQKTVILLYIICTKYLWSDYLTKAEWRICICKQGHHWFRLWLLPSSAPSHHLNQCWFMDSWEQISVKFEMKYYDLHTWKCIWKHHLQHFSHCKSNYIQISSSHPNSNEVSATKFCTWYNSCTAIACATVGKDLMSRNWIRLQLTHCSLEWHHMVT